MRYESSSWYSEPQCRSFKKHLRILVCHFHQSKSIKITIYLLFKFVCLSQYSIFSKIVIGFINPIITQDLNIFRLWQQISKSCSCLGHFLFKGKGRRVEMFLSKTKLFKWPYKVIGSFKLHSVHQNQKKILGAYYSLVSNIYQLRNI